MYQSPHKDPYLVISTLPEWEYFFLCCMYTIANTAIPMHRRITTTDAITPPAMAPEGTWESPGKLKMKILFK